VKLPAGTFPLPAVIRVAGHNNFTIRGAGPGLTILKCGGGGAFYFGQADYPYPVSGGQAIISGATTGSTTVTVLNTSAFAQGKLCHISQLDPSWVVGNDSPRNMTITMRVTAITGSTVTFDHPLPISFNNSPQLIPYPTAPMTGVGIEDLTIDGQNAAGQAIAFEQAWGCWVKNVEITRAAARQMFLIVFNQGSIVHCYTHAVNGGGPNHEGIDFYNRGCWNLVEDNICDNGGFAPITLGDSHGGCVGNVIDYNYVLNISTASDTSGASIALNHGAHNMFNLVEGNIVNTGISSDGYYGSNSHNTIFRNWARGRAETVGGITVTQGMRAIQLNRMTNYINVVGNVLGDSSWPTDATVAYDLDGSVVKFNVYSLGFPNLGNFGYGSVFGPQTPPDYTLAPNRTLPAGYQGLDHNVRNTILRHGNYDYKNRALVWDATIADHSIPNSLYYSSKPGFFGNLFWPPIDPASPGTLTPASIPAGYRAVNGSDPPGADGGGGGGSNQLPSISLTAPVNGAIVTAPASITITATASDPDGTVAKVEFFDGTTKLGEDTSSPYSFSWTSVPAGDHVISTKATDNIGGVTTSGSVTIHVAAIQGTSFNANVAGGIIISPFVVSGTAPAFVSQPSPTTDPALGGVGRYYFDVPATGNYQVRAQVICADEGSNSFFAQIDSAPTTSNIWDILPAAGIQTRTVSWGGRNNPAQVFNLSTGVHHYLEVRGREGDAQLVSITLVGENTPPTVSITDPADGEFFTPAPATVPIAATAADADGTVTKVEFFANGAKIGEDTTSPFTLSWTSVPAGNYILTAKATDNGGLTTDSTGIAIQVLPPSPSYQIKGIVVLPH
jgi:hypothetical protein